MAEKRETVHISTFNKWPFKDEFLVLEKSDEDQILKLQCKICAAHLGEIRQEAKRRKIKGSVLHGIVNYVDGVQYIHKTNISRHIRSGGLHDWAKKKFCPQKQPTAESSGESHQTDCPKAKKPAQRIDLLISSNARTCYHHYFITALSLVEEEWAFNDFRSLVKMQRKNGVAFLSGKDDNVRCREFVSFLAKAIRNDIQEMILRANFFSGMMDGSQARKTGAEKELVFAKIVVNGSPTEILLKCQHMPDFGGEDANAVKKAYDNALLEEYKLPQENFVHRMVSVCTDGASVNMGKYNGACTQLKAERDWLLVIHCANHRLELAIKDAFGEDGSFKEVDEVMTQIYYIFRNSGKAKRIISSLARDVLGVTFVSFVKASGTRFQNHKYRAIKAMIVNFLPLCLYIENLIEGPRSSRTENVAKMRGYLNKFLSYKYLASLHLYRQVLEQTAHLSYIMQNPSILITDVVEALGQAKDKLNEITESEEDLPFPAVLQEDGSTVITAQGTNLPASSSTSTDRVTLTKTQERQIKKFTHVTRQEYKIRNVHAGKQAVRAIKETLLPAIADKIEERFSSFLSEEDIYDAMQVIDHTCWDFDQSDYGIDKIKRLSQYFQTPLSRHHFNVDTACYEFRHLKQLVHNKYTSHRNKVNLWRQLFTHYADRFPHILLLVELCLCISISSATVERGFSAAGRILTDARVSLKKQTLDDLMVLRVNINGMRKLDPNYDEKLIHKALDLYLASSQRSRYHKTKTGAQGFSGPSTVGESRSFQAESSEDTFLPTPFRPPVNSLLEDAPFPITISESESDEEEEEEAQSDEKDDSDMDEEIVLD